MQRIPRATAIISRLHHSFRNKTSRSIHLSSLTIRSTCRGPMNEIMSYQYPPPGTPPPPYDTGYPVPPHSTGMDMRSPGQPGRNALSAMSFDLKRSGSHPNVKMDPSSAQGLDDQTMAAGGEKKKGKLSYHRASTACSKSPSSSFRYHGPAVLEKSCILTRNLLAKSQLSKAKNSVPGHLPEPVKMQDMRAPQ